MGRSPLEAEGVSTDEPRAWYDGYLDAWAHAGRYRRRGEAA